ncbi:MAG: hypothetical protein H0W77_15040 [Acidobacteria bacterium]|nr:hypothetical protein [Acidobacteriota bacterium]
MNKFLLILSLTIISFSACYSQKQAQKLDWKEFVSDEGKFKATFPDVPKRFVEELDKQDGKFQSYRFEIELPRKWFAVSYYDTENSVTLNEDQLNARYDYLRDETLKLPKYKYELMSERKISVNGKLGRETIFKVNNSTILTTRMYRVGNRFFQVSTTIHSLTADEAAKNDANRFLDSFQLIEDGSKNNGS